MLSYGLAVFISMLVAMTVTPALCLALLHRGSLREKESPVLRVLKRGYTNVLKRVLRRPAPSMVGAVAIALAGVLIYPTLGTQLLPNFKERDFLMHWLTEPSTAITQEKRVSIEACRDLRDIPGVRNCGSHIGQALLSDEVYGAYFGENWISVSDKVDYDKTLDTVTDTVDSYPGMQRDVQTYLRERVKEVLTGSSGPVVVRIFGRTRAHSPSWRTRPSRRSVTRPASSRPLPPCRRRSPRSRSSSTWRRPASTISSLATSAVSRRSTSPARRSPTSSRAGVPMTCTSGLAHHAPQL